MADIIKNDVRTYVRELIAKEFGTNTNAEKVPSDNRETNSDVSRNGQQPPFQDQLLMGN